MNCFDCLSDDQRTTTAVAVCSSCGAALCERHAHVAHAVLETHHLGNPSVVVLPARRLYCGACDPAVQGVPEKAHARKERAAAH